MPGAEACDLGLPPRGRLTLSPPQVRLGSVYYLIKKRKFAFLAAAS
jgi:hypothetical protein